MRESPTPQDGPKWKKSFCPQLQHAPGKATATIYDFIAVPDLEELGRSDRNALTAERSLVRKELQRVNEFAESAINAGDALKALRSLKIDLNLMDM